MSVDNQKQVRQDVKPDGGIQLRSRGMKQILFSSFMGSVIEAYDFTLFAVAASLIFNKLFFENLSPAMATFTSFMTLAAGYVARPVGGIIFGHFGDRLGRKSTLIVTMTTMGVASTAIGLLPTTAQVGVIAPVMLLVLRVIQGFALGGEWGGAMLIAFEHAPRQRRGFAAVFAVMGAPAGAVLATLAVAWMTSLPHAQFVSWGWRVPFLFSIVLVLIGLLIRLCVSESPVFQRLAEESRGKTRRFPLIEVCRRHWRKICIALVIGIAGYSCQGILTVWALSEVVQGGANKSMTLDVKAVAAAGMVIVMWFSARLSDRWGRRPVLLLAVSLGLVLTVPMLDAVNHRTVAGYAIALLLGNSLVQGMLFGAFGALVAEQFPPELRYTGSSISYQAASTLGAGFTPAIATSLVAFAGGSFVFVKVAWLLTFVAAGMAVLLIKSPLDAE